MIEIDTTQMVSSFLRGVMIAFDEAYKLVFQNGGWLLVVGIIALLLLSILIRKLKG